MLERVGAELSNEILGKAIAELKTNPFSKEAVTNYWRAKLQADGKRIGLTISVPDCNWTEEEIRRPMVDVLGKEVPSMMVYVPQELTGEEGWAKLRQMYPKMRIYSVRSTTYVEDNPDVKKRGGWVKVEAAIRAPNRNTIPEELESHAVKQGYLGQRFSTYILASQASKDLTGCGLDDCGKEDLTWARIGSSGEHFMVGTFDSGWDLPWGLGPRDRASYLGGRFEKVVPEEC